MQGVHHITRKHQETRSMIANAVNINVQVQRSIQQCGQPCWTYTPYTVRSQRQVWLHCHTAQHRQQQHQGKEHTRLVQYHLHRQHLLMRSKCKSAEVVCSTHCVDRLNICTYVYITSHQRPGITQSMPMPTQQHHPQPHLAAAAAAVRLNEP